MAIIEMFRGLCSAPEALWWTVRSFSCPRQFFIYPRADMGPHDNLQESQYGQGRQYPGRLRLFPDFSEYLDDDQTSNASPNYGGVIALANQHEIFGQFKGGSHNTFH